MGSVLLHDSNVGYNQFYVFVHFRIYTYRFACKTCRDSQKSTTGDLESQGISSAHGDSRSILYQYDPSNLKKFESIQSDVPGNYESLLSNKCWDISV